MAPVQLRIAFDATLGPSVALSAHSITYTYRIDRLCLEDRRLFQARGHRCRAAGNIYYTVLASRLQQTDCGGRCKLKLSLKLQRHLACPVEYPCDPGTPPEAGRLRQRVAWMLFFGFGCPRPRLTVSIHSSRMGPHFLRINKHCDSVLSTGSYL